MKENNKNLAKKCHKKVLIFLFFNVIVLIYENILIGSLYYE